jgi:RNA polymerase sigma factor (sigma-70 family)
LRGFGHEHPAASSGEAEDNRYGDGGVLLVGCAEADPVDPRIEHEAMWTLLRALPPRQRAVLVLRYYEGLSEAEIAETLHMSRGTVKSHASRALPLCAPT